MSDLSPYAVKFLTVQIYLSAQTKEAVHRTLRNLCGLNAAKEEDLDQFIEQYVKTSKTPHD